MKVDGRSVQERSEQLLVELGSLSDPVRVKGMMRFGIAAENALGVPVPDLRRIAKRVGKDHDMAISLWAMDVHEAKILASMVDDPKLVTEEQMDTWAMDLYSWDICDQCCMNLFDRTPFVYSKAREWSMRSEEYVKRAGFALIAASAVHDKKADDSVFLDLLPLIREGASDDRNFVKKAVNWALRQIGKRDRALNQAAIELAEEMSRTGTGPARWIASDALRELRSDKVKGRLRNIEASGEG